VIGAKRGHGNRFGIGAIAIPAIPIDSRARARDGRVVDRPTSHRYPRRLLQICETNGYRELGERSQVVHDGRLRLCANGLAFSRKLIRTGVPGSSKNSRSELTR
jgi:hypothetical protein